MYITVHTMEAYNKDCYYYYHYYYYKVTKLCMKCLQHDKVFSLTEFNVVVF